ncbi:MAG: hypothetical protein ABIJ97_02080 [Bacteroidota bacterium]
MGQINSTYYFLGLLLVISLISCNKKDEDEQIVDRYDVVLVIGQSNTHQGLGLDTIIDAPDERIKQLGRFNENNLKIIQAREPLDHFTKQNNQIGFALTFAKE